MNIEDQTISFYGGTYTGELFNSAPSGLGAWVHPDGHAYIGKWINGDFNGHAAVTLEGGSTYVGGCQHDQFTPEGVTFSQPGSPHKDRVFHGQGTLTDPDGTKYVGEWRLGKPWNGTRSNKDGVVTEKYSEGVRAPIFFGHKLPPAPKNKPFNLGVFLIVPALLGWFVIGMIVLFILIAVMNIF